MSVMETRAARIHKPPIPVAFQLILLPTDSSLQHTLTLHTQLKVFTS